MNGFEYFLGFVFALMGLLGGGFSVWYANERAHRSYDFAAGTMLMGGLWAFAMIVLAWKLMHLSLA